MWHAQARQHVISRSKHPLSGESTFSPRETVPKTRVLFPDFIVSRFPEALFKLCIVMIVVGFFFFAVSICPAAGQVVEKTPCPAVKFFVNFQLIISNPCPYAMNTKSH